MVLNLDSGVLQSKSLALKAKVSPVHLILYLAMPNGAGS